MRFRTFGKTGVNVSEVGFGAWAIGGPARLGNAEVGWGKVDDKQSIQVLEKAFDLGINFFDTANVYGNGHSEELIGSVFEKKRDKVLICTKYGNKTDEHGKWVKDFSPAYARECLTGSLKRLRTDYVDFLLVHTPFPHLNILDLEDSVAELERLKDEGKIRFWGISINPVSHGLDAIQHKRGSALQVVFNALEQEPADKLFPAALQNGVGIIARVPLASGLLTGKFRKGETFPEDDHRSHTLPSEKLDAAIDKVEKLRPLARAHGITMAQLSLLFILSYEAVSVVIPGAKTTAQLEDNTAVGNLDPLTNNEIDTIKKAVE